MTTTFCILLALVDSITAVIQECIEVGMQREYFCSEASSLIRVHATSSIIDIQRLQLSDQKVSSGE